LGINPASRCTCIKPSGTESLWLGGVSAGIHPHHSKRYIRRVRVDVNNDVGARFIKYNSHMYRDGCLLFPMLTDGLTCDPADGDHYISGIALLDKVIEVQKSWCDHGVSCTIHIEDDDERNAVINKLWANRRVLRGVSLVPNDIDKRYPNAPRERGNDQLWHYLVNNCRTVDYTGVDDREIGGACEGVGCILGDVHGSR